MDKKYSYEKTLKTKPENDFFNLQSLLFVTSKQITKLLYQTPVTPHQVIFLSMVFGITASYLIIQNSKVLVIIGAVLLFYKNVLDKVDGSLARAKGLDSRRGRFYDSISDFIVTLTSFSAITYKLYLTYKNPWVIAVGFAAMIFSMLQCSYFIYYQVAFILHSGKQTVNRQTEEITQADLNSPDKWTLFLQRLFLIIYGWQDKLFDVIDKFLYNKLSKHSDLQIELNPAWYQNKAFLTMASVLSIGTHIFLICVFAVLNCFEYYLFMNLICMNLLLIFTVLYHYISTKKLLKKAVN